VVRPLLLPALLIPCSRSVLPLWKGGWREAEITAELAAIVEFPIEHFADQHAGEFGADRPELLQSLDLLRVEMRRCLVANDGVAFRLNGVDHLQHDFEALQFPSDFRFQPRRQLLALHRAQLL
jgi:hypothetical protein